MNSSFHTEASVRRFCPRCGLEILDETWACPLCRGAVSAEGTENAGENRSLAYPDISRRVKKMMLAIKIVIFVSVVAEIILLIINYKTTPGFYWALIPGVALAYICLTLLVAYREKNSLQWRIAIQLLFGAVLLLGLDWAIGYRGWSVRLGFPILIMTADLICVIIMTVNVYGWQNYVNTEIAACIFAVVLAVLQLTGVLEFSILGLAAAGAAVLVLAGTLLFGQRMIRDELKRRFKA